MKIVVHTILVWLLLLAVPFQGFAAAGMLPCAPVTPAPMAMQLAGVEGHCAMHAAATPAADGKQLDHKTAHGKSSCASCCAGAAMAPALMPTPVAPAGPDFVSIPFRAGHVPSVDPSLPERPPRTAFA